MSPQDEKQQLWIILLIVFIGFVGTTIAYPIFPPLFLDNTQETMIPAFWPDNMRSIMLGIALAVYPLGQFLGSPILGTSSDRYGRKLILVLSLIGTVAGYLLSALALQFNWLWILILSRFLTGFMEGNIAIVKAMAADLSSISKFKSIGRINALGSLGYVIGPLLGGFLSDRAISPWFSFSLPFYLALLLSIVAVFLAFFKLAEKKEMRVQTAMTLGQRFNFVNNLRLLCQQNEIMKYLLIISTIFTFAVDIFYEFGPVYLTTLWSLSPSGIAMYNAILCLTLAIGAGWLPQYLSAYFPLKQVIAIAILFTAFVFGLMSVFTFPVFVFLLFGFVGLSIATVSTNMTIQVSDAADQRIQGEAMGAQLALRTLGDTIICLTGGFLIISSVILPLALSSVIALGAFMVYIRIFRL